MSLAIARLIRSGWKSAYLATTIAGSPTDTHTNSVWIKVFRSLGNAVGLPDLLTAGNMLIFI